MKGCELCRHPARMYCEADGASLCWDCDEKVHSANFLVAKHSRSLLCHACQSPTPWNASGTKLTPTVSVCATCLDDDTYHALEEGEDDCCSDEDVDKENSSDDDDDDGDDRDDGDYQVVPWSSALAQPPPRVACSSSCSEEVSSTRISSAGEVFPLNRSLENAYRDSQDGIGCTFSMAVTSEALQRDEATSSSSGSGRPLKKLRRPNQEELKPEREGNLPGTESWSRSSTAVMILRSLRELTRV